VVRVQDDHVGGIVDCTGAIAVKTPNDVHEGFGGAVSVEPDLPEDDDLQG
jgi:hypothetical protein